MNQKQQAEFVQNALQQLHATPTDQIIAKLTQRGGNIADVGDLSRAEIIDRAVALRMIQAVIQEEMEATQVQR